MSGEIEDDEPEIGDVEYLRSLAEKLMRIPVIYGTNQSDCDRLYDIALKVELAGALTERKASS